MKPVDEDFVVSDDLEVDADLWARFEELGSHGLAEYALSIGLRPPGYEAGQRHSISEYAPPGHDGRGYLVWDVGLWFPDPEDQDDEDEDDGTDPWENAAPPTPPGGSNEAKSGPDPWAGF